MHTPRGGGILRRVFLQRLLLKHLHAEMSRHDGPAEPGNVHAFKDLHGDQRPSACCQRLVCAAHTDLGANILPR